MQFVLQVINTWAFGVSAVGMLGLTFVDESSPTFLPIVLLVPIYVSITMNTGGFLKSPLYMAPQFAGLLASMHMVFNFSSGIALPYLVSAMTPNGTAKEWHNVFYTAMTIGVIAAVVFLVFGSGELQPWGRSEKIHVKQKPSTISLVRISDND